MFLDSGKCFGLWKVFLDSGKCLRFWEVFWILFTCFWILGSVLDSGKCFVAMGHNNIQLKPFDPTELFFSMALFCLVCCTNCY